MTTLLPGQAVIQFSMKDHRYKFIAGGLFVIIESQEVIG